MKKIIKVIYNENIDVMYFNSFNKIKFNKKILTNNVNL